MTRTVLLGDIARIKGGKRLPKGEVLQETPNAHPYLRIVDMGEKSLKTTNLQYVPDDVFPKISHYITNTDDILLSIVGTIGLVAIVDKDLDNASLTENCVKLTCDRKRVDPSFLYYFLTSSVGQAEISAGRVGSTQPKLPLYNIAKIKVPDLSLTDQKKIADVLGTLDDKVELNRKMNETLEQMGQALFRHYFIYNPEAINWIEKPLDQVAHFLNGVAMQKYPADGGATLSVIKIREMSAGITSNTDIGSANIPEKYIVHDGDILFSWSGTLIVKPWCDGEGALNQHLFKVTSSEYPKWFYYFWIRHHLQSFIETAAGKATTMGHIQRRHLTDAKIKVPPRAELVEINNIMEPILDLEISNELQLRKLKELRDSLLPRLISGRIEL